MIYFIQSGEGGPVKVGFAKTCARHRIAELQTGNPVPLILLALCDGELADESRAHKFLQSSRFRIAGKERTRGKYRSEWFSRSPKLEKLIADVLAGKSIVEATEQAKSVFPDWDGWTLDAVARIVAVHGRIKLARYLGVCPAAVAHWLNRKAVPSGRHMLTMFIGLPEFFDPFPSPEALSPGAIDFQLRVIARRSEALSALKSRCLDIRRERAA